MPARRRSSRRGPTRRRRSMRGRRNSRSPKSRRCGAIPMRSMRAAFLDWCRSSRCCAIPALPSAALCSTTSCAASPETCPDPAAADAGEALVAAGRARVRRGALPADIEAVWWPRFRRLGRQYPGLGAPRSAPWPGGAWPRCAPSRWRSATPASTLSGYADRIDLLPAGRPTSSTTRPARRRRRRRRTR